MINRFQLRSMKILRNNLEGTIKRHLLANYVRDCSSNVCKIKHCLHSIRTQIEELWLVYTGNSDKMNNDENFRLAETYDTHRWKVVDISDVRKHDLNQKEIVHRWHDFCVNTDIRQSGWASFPPSVKPKWLFWVVYKPRKNAHYATCPRTICCYSTQYVLHSGDPLSLSKHSPENPLPVLTEFNEP